MFKYYAKIISKIILVLVVPHWAIAFPERPGARDPSGRSNEKSTKLFKARHSYKAAL